MSTAYLCVFVWGKFRESGRSVFGDKRESSQCTIEGRERGRMGMGKGTCGRREECVWGERIGPLKEGHIWAVCRVVAGIRENVAILGEDVCVCGRGGGR